MMMAAMENSIIPPLLAAMPVGNFQKRAIEIHDAEWIKPFSTHDTTVGEPIHIFLSRFKIRYLS